MKRSTWIKAGIAAGVLAVAAVVVIVVIRKKKKRAKALKLETDFLEDAELDKKD